VAHTLCAPEVTAPLPAQPIDPPTLAMSFRVNDSPFAGTEGDKVTSRVIRDRLLREAEGNVAIRVTESSEKDAYEVAGRGELQLGILIETMRREGFELGVSRPQVLFERDPDSGELMEPIEEVTIDLDEEFSGIVVQKLSELLSDTRGTAVFNRVFHAYAPYKGEIEGRRTGVLISNGEGEAVAYALWNLEDRGPMMVVPGTRVYQGMIVGEHARGNDLVVNVLKGKKLTNIRAAGKDDNVLLTPPIRMTLEKALAYIADDELVEVTPQSIRLRKRVLDPNERKKEERRKEAAGV
jgi:GTP-binding protein